MRYFFILVICVFLNVLYPLQPLADDLTLAAAWDEVAIHTDNRKYNAALESVGRILTKARTEGDEEHWARALVERTRLQIAMGQPETAVHDLRQAAWPQDPLWRSAIELYSAHALMEYQRRYSHEIRSREFVAEADSVDIKTWTNERMSAEINGAFLRVWSARESWGRKSNGTWALFMVQNNYPARIRGTLRDAISYLWVEQLANTQLWLPGQQDESRDLDLEFLLAGPDDTAATQAPPDLTDPQVHPLLKIGHILRDLQDWHLAHQHREAALEAELEHLRRLRGAIANQPDQVRIRQYLATRLADFDPAFPWWTQGQWQLARFLQRENAPDNLIRAHLAALQGERRHPGQHGSQRCASLRQELEQPQFTLQAMSHDAAQQRSVQIQHKNLGQLHFQAWPIDVTGRVDRRRGPYFNGDEIRTYVTEKEPAFSWTVALPTTEDYKMHSTYTGLPACEPGAYLVVASSRRDFDPDNGLLAALTIVISDLVLTTQVLDHQVEFMARSGSTGQPLSNVDLTINAERRRGRDEPEKSFQLKTDTTGRVRMEFNENQTLRIFAKKNGDIAWQYARNPNRIYTRPDLYQSFIYTDRAVYRPGQTVHWKVIAYKGNGDRTEFQTRDKASGTVRLVDSNNQEAATEFVRTNAFGSAAGSFVIPESGLLGNWSLRDTYGGNAYFRVEQYKRPTFEAQLLDPAEPLVLNQPATVTGQAKYLFGTPVTSGQVKWRVSRTVSSPNPYWRSSLSGQQTIATGTTELDATGQFSLNFLPAVGARREPLDVAVFRYQVEADITDQGGETRSTKRVFNLGFVSLQATIEKRFGFLSTDQAAVFTIKRTDLNEVPQSGPGQWSLYALQQPERALLPAEMAVDPRQNDQLFDRTPGDDLNPRWQGFDSNLAIPTGWETGELIASGSLTHGTNGQAKVELQGLATGPYRIVYTTADETGEVCEAQLEFLALGSAPRALNLPLVLVPQYAHLAVGDTARFLIHSGLTDQDLYLQVFEGGLRTRSEFIRAGSAPGLLEFPVTEAARSGLKVTLSTVRDHQHLMAARLIRVPWDNMKLKVEFATFRDKLAPGSNESFTVRIKSADGSPVNPATTELLAYMYDRSLDAFATHSPPATHNMFASARWAPDLHSNLGLANMLWRMRAPTPRLQIPGLHADRLVMRPGSAIVVMRAGELFVRGGRSGEVSMQIDGVVLGALAKEGTPLLPAFDVEGAEYMVEVKSAVSHLMAGAEVTYKYAQSLPESPDSEPVQLRENFTETAFFLPYVQIDDKGEALIEYQVPDSVTDWSVWVHALTRDLHSGSAQRRASSVKDLMVRPYLPRFLREGDRADLNVVINNAGESVQQGWLDFSISDPVDGRDLGAAFSLTDSLISFEVEPGASTTLTIPLTAPAKVGSVLIKTIARTNRHSDGEQRLLPVLPGRMHLMQSRFVTLNDRSRRELKFPTMAADDDATRVHDQLVITIDAQLFGSVLSALPYLVQYPHECTEQTLNRYLSTAMVAGVFKNHPQIQAMAAQMSGRETRLEAWQNDDPNRRMLLSETPWLQMATGGVSPESLLNLLDPVTVEAQRESALEKLRERQGPGGGFSWFPGGRATPHLTLYILQGLARGTEFGVEAPDKMVSAAWGYLHQHYRQEMEAHVTDQKPGVQLVTLLNYLLSSYPEEVWQASGFTADDRQQMLDFSFRHWREHAVLLNGYLTLTLARAGRMDDARLVFEAVMDNAQTDPDLGTYWAPEDRAWLWYNDRIESHAFSLRVLTEISPDDDRQEGLVQWLLLNKKLGHWKSTRATAEVIYALVHFMEQNGTLGIREVIDIKAGPVIERLVFEPDHYTGRNNQIRIAGKDIDPRSMSTVVVEKETPGFAFASATWHFSTEELPSEADGDLFAISRRYFLRRHDGQRWTLTPLAIGEAVAIGDQVEVQLSIRAKQAAEYVHLRDPRGAGFEPEGATSGYRWQNGLGYYEEFRDSGTNFFFTSLPTGQYTLKYRLRANMSGDFKVGPATLQSMYAPEFTAHSAGRMIPIAH